MDELETLEEKSLEEKITDEMAKGVVIDYLHRY